MKTRRVTLKRENLEEGKTEWLPERQVNKLKCVLFFSLLLSYLPSESVLFLLGPMQTVRSEKD